MTTRLKNGDIVEVITSKSAHGPSRDWVKIARSSEARTKIRQWFKKERRDENIANGRSSFESELKHCGVTLNELTAEENLPGILKRLAFKTLDEMYAAIGYGGVTALKRVGRMREEHPAHPAPASGRASGGGAGGGPAGGDPSRRPQPGNSEQGIVVEGLATVW